MMAPIRQWMDERIRFGVILDFLSKKKVPRHGQSFWYVFGGLAFFFFLVQIVTEIPRSIPIVGEFIVSVLRGGDYIAEESLKRLFTLHVIVLPLITLVL